MIVSVLNRSLLRGSNSFGSVKNALLTIVYKTKIYVASINEIVFYLHKHK